MLQMIRPVVFPGNILSTVIMCIMVNITCKTTPLAILEDSVSILTDATHFPHYSLEAKKLILLFKPTKYFSHLITISFIFLKPRYFYYIAVISQEEDNLQRLLDMFQNTTEKLNISMNKTQSLPINK